MTEHTEIQPHQAAVEQPKGNRWVRRFGASVLSVAAMAGNPSESHALEAASVNADTPTKIELASRGAHTEAQKTPRLRRVTELPGWGIEVTKSEAERLQAATLQLSVRHKELGEVESCTAVKVELPSGGTAGETAAHCLQHLTGHKYGLLSAGVNGYPDTQEARDILGPDSPFEILVLDPRLDPGEREQNPLGRAIGASVKPGEDIALLKIESLQKNGDRSSRTFDDIPALPAKSVIKKPKVGQTGAASAVSMVSGSKLIGGTVVYVGRMKLYNNVEKVSQLVDVVAQTPRTADKDASNFNASGGSIALKGGQFIHTQVSRINLGYGTKSDRNPSDLSYKDSLYYWNLTQRQLGVRLPQDKFNVLSYHQVQTARTIPDLEAGFGKYITMNPPRK